MVDSFLTPKLKEGETVDLSLYNARQRTNIRLYGLACKDWTPQDVFEYRRKWMETATVVYLRGNLDKATKWCKQYLYHQDFQVKKYATPSDDHAIYFAKAEDAMIFKLAIYG